MRGSATIRIRVGNTIFGFLEKILQSEFERVKYQSIWILGENPAIRFQEVTTLSEFYLR